MDLVVSVLTVPRESTLKEALQTAECDHHLFDIITVRTRDEWEAGRRFGQRSYLKFFMFWITGVSEEAVGDKPVYEHVRDHLRAEVYEMDETGALVRYIARRFSPIDWEGNLAQQRKVAESLFGRSVVADYFRNDVPQDPDNLPSVAWTDLAPLFIDRLDGSQMTQVGMEAPL